MNILLFDSGCTSCAAVASGIEELAVGDRLLLRSLRDPQMQTMLTQVRPGWGWEPTLLELDENARPTRARTGVSVAWRLVRVLGIRRARAVAQVVRTHTQPLPLDAVRLSRRSVLLKFGAAAALLPLLGAGRRLEAIAGGPAMDPGRSHPPLGHSRVIWGSAEYQGLRPQIVGPGGAAGQSGPFADEFRDIPDIEPRLVIREQDARSGKTVSAYAFDLTSGPAQEIRPVGQDLTPDEMARSKMHGALFIMPPTVTFLFLDDDLVKVWSDVPDVHQGVGVTTGIGRSAGRPPLRVPMGKRRIEKINRARERAGLQPLDVGSAQAAMIVAGSSPQPAHAGVVCPTGWVCADVEWVECFDWICGAVCAAKCVIAPPWELCTCQWDCDCSHWECVSCEPFP